MLNKNVYVAAVSQFRDLKSIKGFNGSTSVLYKMSINHFYPFLDSGISGASGLICGEFRCVCVVFLGWGIAVIVRRRSKIARNLWDVEALLVGVGGEGVQFDDFLLGAEKGAVQPQEFHAGQATLYCMDLTWFQTFQTRLQEIRPGKGLRKVLPCGADRLAHTVWNAIAISSTHQISGHGWFLAGPCSLSRG